MLFGSSTWECNQDTYIGGWKSLIKPVTWQKTCNLSSAHWWEVWRPSPQGASGSLRWSVIRMEDPQEDPLAMHCFCVCSGSALLADLLGVSRSRERDLQSVLSSYPRFLCIFSLCIVTFFVFVLFCYNLMHVRSFGLVDYICAPFRLATSVLWCWSWEKEWRAVEVVPGI